MHSSAQVPARTVRVGIAGVGNCASSFVQGLTYYGNGRANEPAAGLMHSELGGYRVKDIAISAAFDINATKVGRDVSDAICAQPNNTARFSKVAQTGVIVQRGPTLDGLGKYLRDEIDESDAPEADVAVQHPADRSHSSRRPFLPCPQAWREKVKSRGQRMLKK